MAYYREIRLDELVQWLEETLSAEDGHIYTTADELAEKLFNRFDILTTSNSPN